MHTFNNCGWRKNAKEVLFHVFSPHTIIKCMLISRAAKGASMLEYSLLTLSWPRFESGSLRNGGILILRSFLAFDGMPIEMYGESWIAGLLTSDDVMLYMAGFEMTRGI